MSKASDDRQSEGSCNQEKVNVKSELEEGIGVKNPYRSEPSSWSA